VNGEFTEEIDNGCRAGWEGEEYNPGRQEDRQEFGEEYSYLELEHCTEFRVDLSISVLASYEVETDYRSFRAVARRSKVVNEGREMRRMGSVQKQGWRRPRPT